MIKSIENFLKVLCTKQYILIFTYFLLFHIVTFLVFLKLDLVLTLFYLIIEYLFFPPHPKYRLSFNSIVFVFLIDIILDARFYLINSISISVIFLLGKYKLKKYKHNLISFIIVNLSFALSIIYTYFKTDRFPFFFYLFKFIAINGAIYFALRVIKFKLDKKKRA